MYINLQQKSYYSFGKSPASIEAIVEKNKEIGNPAVCLTDYALHGCVKLEKECKKAWLKPIHGLTVLISPVSSLTLIAKNHKGFLELVKINNLCQTKEDLCVDWGSIGSVVEGDNLILLTGGMGSELANSLFSDLNAYKKRTYEEVKGLVKQDWQKSISNCIFEYEQIFGKSNVVLEVQLSQEFPINSLVSTTMRWAAGKYELKSIASPNSYYIEKSDAQDQRILLCNELKTTLKNVSLRYDIEFGLENFFRTNSYSILSYTEIFEKYSMEEVRNTLLIGESCEQYSILSKPILPTQSNSVENLRQKARDGWVRKIVPYVLSERFPEYTERIKSELKVIEDANLSDYFLIIIDICDFARKNKILIGPGRGSAAGCLVSYLTDITQVDPIRFNLMFERFYNAGRNTKDEVALPDIDLDFPPSKRDDILNYVRKKYGHDRVGQICTFSKMMGRCVLKDILRIHDALSFDEIQKITDNIPDKAKIADELQEMIEEDEDEDVTVIRWSLLNRPDKFKDYCTLKDGKCEGPLASIFEQAMRLEGTPKSTSKHASGVVVSSDKMTDTVPLLKDKSSDEMLVAIELKDSEKYGLVKFDILGIAVLDKFQSYLELTESKSIIKKVISGGQTGADIAGLKAAKKKGIETGGWIPKGFKTQEGPKLEYKDVYGLREHESEQYPPRTFLNVKESDGTLRFASKFDSSGEECTLRAINQYKKPYMDVTRNNPRDSEEVKMWIKKNNIGVLNIAGNSEKTSPGIGKFVEEYLEKVL